MSLGAENLDLSIQDLSHTQWKQCGGLAINAETQINSANSPTSFIDAVTASNAMTLEAWVVPQQGYQPHHPRIFTLSNGSSERNFSLGHDDYDFFVKTRTTSTNLNGSTKVSSTTQGEAEAKLSHVVFTRDSEGNARIYVDGVLASSRSVSGSTSNWADNHLIGVGNEIGGGYPWLGEVYLIAAYSQPLTEPEIIQNYNAGVITDCNMEPFVHIASDVQAGVAPLAVAFDASGSQDYDGTIVNYVWDFGDGSSASGINSSHSYSQPGHYTVTLTVTDDDGATQQASLQIRVLTTNRVTADQIMLYRFDEGSGNIVHDVAGVGAPYDLIAPQSETSWLACGGLSIDLPTFVGANTEPNKLVDAVAASNEITIEAWIKPDSLTQDGPARIVTHSLNTYSRNFTLGQKSNNYNVRLRTSGTNDNGRYPDLTSSGNEVTSNLTHVVYTRDTQGQASLYVDGALVTTTEVSGVINNWEINSGAEHVFGLGGEPYSAGKNWLGDYHLVAIYSRALFAGEVAHNYAQGIENSCTNTNTAPVITSTPVTNVNEGQTYSYAVIASDPQGDAISYSLTGGPAGLGIDSTSGLIQWSAGYQSSGSYPVTISAMDPDGLSMTQSFTLVVNNTNRAPVVQTTAITSGTENTTYSYDVIATDPDDDAISYALTSGPAGMAISSTTGLITWLPGYNDAGSHTVLVSVSDSLGASTSHDYLLVIANVNQAPTANNQILAVTEDNSLAITLTGSDADNDALSYTLLSQPVNGSLAGTAPNLTYQPNADFSGTDSFTFIVNDGSVDSTNATITINVNPLNDAPEITSASVTMGSENNLYSYQVTASDVENDPLTFALVSAPANAGIDSATGLMTWTPNYDEAGSYTVTIAASDGTDQSTQSYTLTIDNTNRAPIISSTAPTTAMAASVYQYQVTASDADGDALTYTLNTPPPGMSIDANGLINWTPTNDQVGTVHFVVMVTDSGGVQVQERVSVVVEGLPNTAPVIAFNPKQRAYVSSPYTQQILATDEDGDTLAYAAIRVPNGMTVDQETGEISWTPDSAQAGSHVITITVYDGNGGTDQDTYTVTVFGDSTVGQIVTAELPDADADRDYRYTIETSGINNDYSFSLLSGPNGMAIDPQTGEITWVPNAADAGASIAKSDQCEATPEPIEDVFDGEFELVEKWHWDDGNNFSEIVSTPIVVNLYDDNDDGVINTDDTAYIVVSGFNNRQTAPAKLRAFNAETGALQWTANVDINSGYASAAAADLDGDGDIEIVTSGPKIFDHNGIEISLPLAVETRGQVSLADIDGDGDPEIIHTGMVYDSSLNPLFAISDRGIPIAVDLDFDGQQEVIANGSAWDNQGNLLWESSVNASFFSASVGNFDHDDFPEIVFGSSDTIQVVNHDGSILWQVPQDGNSTAAPLVADVDGDGLPEIGIVSMAKYSVFETDGQFKWSIPIEDSSSGSSSSTAFDFNGDGALEIVHGDEYYVRILDGKTGAELTSI